MTDYIVQAALGACLPCLDLTAPVHRAYAERHGFEYVACRGNPLPGWHPQWCKVPAILELVSRADTGLVIWLDADTLAVGHADPRDALGDALVGMTRHPGRSTPTTLNAGVIFIRACDQTRDWLQAVLDGGPGVYPWYEQDVMNELLDAPEWAGKVIDLPHIWNSTACLGHPQDCEIRAWHGGGPYSRRLADMRAEMERRGL